MNWINRLTRFQKWVAGILISLVVIFTISVGCFVYYMWKTMAGDLETYQETKSPDGQYVATLYYRNGMTTGYYFVSLDTTRDHQKLSSLDADPSSKVVEVAEEGLNSLVWRNSKTLVVKYDDGHTPTRDAAYFISHPKQWRDVQIIYQVVK